MTFFANKVNVTNTIITKRTIFIIMFAYIITILQQILQSVLYILSTQKKTQKDNKVINN